MDRTEDEDESPSFSAQGKLTATCSGYVKEDQRKAIYCVAWSDDIFVEDVDEAIVAQSPPPSTDESSPTSKRTVTPHYYRCFASCVGRQATIYEIEVRDPAANNWNSQRKSGNIVVKQCYVDPDQDEEFYACAFGGRSVGEPFGLSSYSVSGVPTNSNRVFKKRRSDDESSASTEPSIHCEHMETETEEETAARMQLDPDHQPSGPQLLCVGGKGFAIKVIDTARRKLLMTLSGHGEELGSLKFCPVNEWILLSASFDRSCRLWNLRNATCLAIFAGHEGHKDIVMTGAWHPFGNKIVTGGHDTLIKIWDVGEDTKVGQAIKQSVSVKLKAKANGTFESETYFKPVTCQFPLFSTGKVHFQPVDCVEFIGDLILSKANNIMVLWDPDYTNKEESPEVTHRPPSDMFALQEYKITGVADDFMYYRFSATRSGRTWAVGNMDGDVLLWDDNVGKKHNLTLSIGQKLKTAIRMTAFSPDDRILICCCEDGGIWKWDLYRKATKESPAAN